MTSRGESRKGRSSDGRPAAGKRLPRSSFHAILVTEGDLPMPSYYDAPRAADKRRGKVQMAPLPESRARDHEDGTSPGLQQVT